jgi:hypothetical protein
MPSDRLPSDRLPSDRPVFVVGCPRSGTTMLQLMLHAHPRIAVPPETRFLLAAYRRRYQIGDLAAPENRRALATWIAGTPQFGDLGLRREQVIPAIVAAPGTLGSALGTVFKMYAERFGKPRWGDKRPSYLRNLPILLRLFPDAQIIDIVRDGRDCVASLKETPWRPRDFGDLIDCWARSADASARAARRYPASVYHRVRYEDLVADPVAHLRQICAFLGEDYDPAMAEPWAVAPVAVPGYKTWHRLTRSAITTSRAGSWQQRLTPEEVRRCEAVFGRRLARFGYRPSTRAGRSPAMLVTHARLAARDHLGAARDTLHDVHLKLRSPALAFQERSPSASTSIDSTRSG